MRSVVLTMVVYALKDGFIYLFIFYVFVLFWIKVNLVVVGVLQRDCRGSAAAVLFPSKGAHSSPDTARPSSPTFALTRWLCSRGSIASAAWEEPAFVRMSGVLWFRSYCHPLLFRKGGRVERVCFTPPLAILSLHLRAPFDLWTLTLLPWDGTRFLRKAGLDQR